MDNEPEVIVNLWYVGDKTGLLISLKGRAYVATGSDKEKLSFLLPPWVDNFYCRRGWIALLPPWVVAGVWSIAAVGR